ncbi:unnamed protein product, partial [Rotaria socialis]
PAGGDHHRVPGSAPLTPAPVNHGKHDAQHHA